MSEARLTAGIEASALIGLAQQAGGFGTVLKRGDAERGSLLLVVLERGEPRFLLQRLLQRGGTYEWEARESADSELLGRQVSSATDRDPDLWVIELDVPSAERFVAEMT